MGNARLWSLMYVWPAFCQSQSPAASPLFFSGLSPARRPAASLMVPVLTGLHQHSHHPATWGGLTRCCSRVQTKLFAYGELRGTLRCAPLLFEVISFVSLKWIFSPLSLFPFTAIVCLILTVRLASCPRRFCCCWYAPVNITSLYCVYSGSWELLWHKCYFLSAKHVIT